MTTHLPQRYFRNGRENEKYARWGYLDSHDSDTQTSKMNHWEIIRGSLSELYDCISVERDESKYISFNISCLNNVDISTFEAMQFLNRYFFFIIEYLLLRPNLKIHADGFRIKKQSILDHQIIFNSPCWA